MQNVFIFGSCVSRDTIEASKLSFNIVDYYARSSFYSLAGNAATYNLNFIEEIKSAFQRRMVKRDLLKSLFASPPPANIDLILVDFIDERCGLIKAEDGSVATLSREFSSIIERNLKYQKIRNDDASYYEGFEKGFLKFLEYFNVYKDKIRIIKAYWASNDDLSSPLSTHSSHRIKTQNHKLQMLYEIASKHVNQNCFIDITNASLIAASKHKWGVAPFHYINGFYEEVLLAIFNQKIFGSEPMNPYTTLPDRAFWKLSVADLNMFDINGLWTPKFAIDHKDKISTYGSCFAQHIGRSLKSKGFDWFIPERPPAGMNEKSCKLFNYDIFSSRTGNIYTTSLLKQWTQWAFEEIPTPEEVWKKDGRFFDPFRPVVEPMGFESLDEVLLSRKATIGFFKESIIKAKYLVFTLGLTECWINTEKGYEYPMCPGTSAGTFNPSSHAFKNQQFNEVLHSLRDAIILMRRFNPDLKFILTVSPVPLTATYSANHVLVATMESKSILRAVAGQLSKAYKYIDYFPSYEIINSPPFKAAFFEPNLRSVNHFGVTFVMDSFFRCLANTFGENVLTPSASSSEQKASDVICEEEILQSFRV